VPRVFIDRGVAPAQVALAWVPRNPVVSASIVGATRIDENEAAALHAYHLPHPRPGF
jgi:aryl-alcohol dehydrogenase-like predicted oxidoreductase